VQEWMLASKNMCTLQTIASATPTVERSVRHWIYQLGGLGFIPLGLFDNSVIPLPGSMDVLTIFLSARTVVVVLRLDGDGRVGDRRLCYLQACAQRREGDTRTQVPAQEAGEGIQDL
jgi:hypothetical protein